MHIYKITFRFKKKNPNGLHTLSNPQPPFLSIPLPPQPCFSLSLSTMSDSENHFYPFIQLNADKILTTKFESFGMGKGNSIMEWNEKASCGMMGRCLSIVWNLDVLSGMRGGLHSILDPWYVGQIWGARRGLESPFCHSTPLFKNIPNKIFSSTRHFSLSPLPATLPK